MSEIIKLDSIEHKDILDISAVDMEAALSGYDVGSVNALLDGIIADKSMRKKVRRQVVSHVIKHQPHPTKGFERYDKWNSDFRRQVDREDLELLSVFVVGSFLLFLVPFLLARGEIQGIFTGLVLGGFALGVGIFSFFWNTASPLFHDDVYGIRANISSRELRDRQDKKSERERIARIKQDRQQLAELTARLAGEKGEVSLVDAKQDFVDAKARIASYETDMTKALKYPAFNDITVPAVNTMIRQLRTCQRMIDNVNHEYSASEVSASVDNLWVDIKTAEKAAENIAWSTMTEDERGFLKSAQQLLVQAQDSGNTEVMRANLYSRLKDVVSRLNEQRTIIPAPIVGEIEHESRKLLTTTNKETAEA